MQPLITVFVAMVMLAAAGTDPTEAPGTPGLPAHARQDALVVAMVPFTNQSGSAALDALISRIDQAAAAKAAGLTRAKLALVSTTAGLRATDRLATIAARTQAKLVIRGTVSVSAAQVELAGTVVNAADGAVIHVLPVERAPQADPTPAVERLASRIAGVLAVHSDPERKAPQLYSVQTIEAYRMARRADTVFNQTREADALPLYTEAYRLDTMVVSALFPIIAIHGNAGRTAQRDSMLRMVDARRERLTNVERYSYIWFHGTPREAFVAARSAAVLDPDGWTYGTGLRANHAGYFADAATALSGRAALAAKGDYGAKTWPAWRSQYMTALHATGNFTRELAEVQLARTELAGATQDWFYPQELRALAGLHRLSEFQTVQRRLLAKPRDSVNIDLMQTAALELQRHGYRAEGDALLREVATIALALEGSRDSIVVATALTAAGRHSEALERFAAMTAGSSAVARLGRYGAAAALAGRTEIASQMDARLAQVTTGTAAGWWRGMIAAARGDCSAAVGFLRTATEGGVSYGNGVWWHASPWIMPIAGCSAYESLPAMRAPE